MRPHAITGIIPPLVTPLTSQLRLDRMALERLIEHVIAGGVHGIFLLGSTGEGPSIQNKLRTSVIQAGIQITRRRVPVLLNISSASYLEVVHQLEMASQEGADYAVLSPPYYYRMNQRELVRFYTEIANSSTIPLLLYNAPQYTKTEIEPGSVRILMNHERIAGIKDSSGDMNYIRALLKARKVTDFNILVGPELLLAKSLLGGCDGGICGGANLYPGLYVKLFESVLGNKEDDLLSIQTFLEKINAAIYNVADSPMNIVLGLKTMLSMKGICSPQMAMPVHGEISAEKLQQMEQLDRDLANHGF